MYTIIIIHTYIIYVVHVNIHTYVMCMYGTCVYIHNIRMCMCVCYQIYCLLHTIGEVFSGVCVTIDNILSMVLL